MFTQKTVEHFYTNKTWLFTCIIALSAIVSFAISAVSLKMGYTSVFQNIFYIPVILACAFYHKRGFLISFVLWLVHFLLVISFSPQAEIIHETLWNGVFLMSVAALILYLTSVKGNSLPMQRHIQTDFHSLISNLSGVVYRYAPGKQRRVEYMSDHIEKLTGFRAEDLMHKGTVIFENLVHPEDLSFYKQTIHAAIKDEGTWEMDYRIFTKEGQLKWVHEKGKMHRKSFDNKACMDGIIIDIHHTKQVEEDKRIKALDASPDGISILNTKGRFIYLNTAHVNLYGYEQREELLNQSWKILYGEDEIDRIENTIMPLLRKSGRWRGEATGKKRDGLAFPQEISLSIIKNGGIICVVRDISQRIEKQKQEKEMAIARQTLVFKHNFLANMSHEMRTPLTGILGMLEVLDHSLLNPTHQEYVKDIKDSAGVLKDMIDQVLDFTRIEQGEVSLRPERFNLSDMLDNICYVYNKTCEAKSIEFLLIKDHELPKYILADKSRIARVISILLSNAIKFTHQGNIAVKARLYDAVEENNQLVLLFEVSDTGIGVADEEQESIFEPFTYLHESDTRAYDGSGLGLPIAKELVALHGGEIGLISTQGDGSTFWFTIVADKISH